MANTEKTYGIIGGMANPNMAHNFSENTSPDASIFDIATDVRNHAGRALSGVVEVGKNLAALPIDVGVRAPVHAITRTARTGLNVVFGAPWAAGHRTAKFVEDSVDMLNPSKKGSGYGMAA